MFKQTRKTENGVWCLSKVLWSDDTFTEYEYDEKGREVNFRNGEFGFDAKTDYIDLSDGGYISIYNHYRYGDTISHYNKDGKIILFKNEDTIEYYIYDEHGNPIQLVKTLLDEDNNVTSIETNEYHYENDILVSESGKDGTVKYINDEKGRPTEVINTTKEGISIHEYIEYDNNGNIISSRITVDEKETQETKNTYNDKGLLIKSDFIGLGDVINEYDDNGNLIHIINNVPDGSHITLYNKDEDEEFYMEGIDESFYTYDEYGNLIESTSYYKDGTEDTIKYEYTFIS